MLGYDDIAAAAAGEERDALWRSLAEEMEAAAAARRDGPGFVRASTPADLARALGRDRRERRARLSTGTPRRGDPGRRQA
ncbi:hypothetical protein PUR29_10520 [Methylobacterium ajmalii]|uniref:Uncharacterized protein n=2 Tax=Methylobacterium TaxID=407 RepID=A0A0C6FSQ6_9HYPH|nr:hypothetical protein [Methylobacterium aquaticum]QRE77148.1 hypothetical protein F1D61_29665 [Methylobacterium aquaticum]BAQ45875.1 conserved hypothetical protein [Methylobacterium aquaticum]